MSLTAKQQREVEQFLSIKVDALRRLSRHLGMKTNPSILNDWEKLAVILRMVDPSALPIQRAACAFILDMVSDDWRTVAGPSILGMIVSRHDREVQSWRKAVIANDNGQCRRCGSTKKLHAHHIVRWADAPELRVVPSNGMTLCETCHIAEHRKAR
jgi:hypothetical protein